MHRTQHVGHSDSLTLVLDVDPESNDDGESPETGSS